MAVFRDQRMKLAAALKHGLRLVQLRRRSSRRQTKGLQEQEEEQQQQEVHTEPACDNALNELLESRLRQLIAGASPAALQDLENPRLVHAAVVVVPACPDSVCRQYRLTVQSCLQAAQPQVG